MERPVRIGLAGLTDGRVPEALQQLPSRPEVRAFPDLYGSIEALLAADLDVVFLHGHTEVADLPGALRLLRSLRPLLQVVLVAPPEHESAATTLARRHGARVLTEPCAPGELAAVLEQVRSRSDGPRADAFVDLARGLADEINGPLQFLAGHLQLLACQLDPAADAAQKQRIDAALTGARRIEASVERIHLVARAAGGPRQPARVDLWSSLQRLAARLPARPAPLPIRCEPERADFAVTGDPTHLDPALEAFLQAASELQDRGCTVAVLLSALATGMRVRLQATGAALRPWRLPRSYEPYYLNRLLRGTTLGLSLFLAQAAVLGHGGEATAHRLPDDTIVLDLLLPAA